MLLIATYSSHHRGANVEPLASALLRTHESRDLIVAESVSTLSHTHCSELSQHSAACLVAHANEAAVEEGRTLDTLIAVLDKEWGLNESGH